VSADQGFNLSPPLSDGSLIGSGTYQFFNLKANCVAKFRIMLAFFMYHGAPWRIKAELIGLGFVGGINNLQWMRAATILMLLEKPADIGAG
jgi:predicted metal-binding membrane protein